MAEPYVFLSIFRQLVADLGIIGQYFANLYQACLKYLKIRAACNRRLNAANGHVGSSYSEDRIIWIEVSAVGDAFVEENTCGLGRRV
jgi:hypothetical protein